MITGAIQGEILVSRGRTEGTIERLIEEIEIIRVRRMSFFRGKHPGGRRFSQQELNDLACSTYKNYLDGRSRRIPDYEDLNRIADYLECSVEERNHLLAIARYTPLPAMNSAESTESDFDKAKKLMRDLQFPSLLVTRDYAVHTVCPNMRALVGVPHLDEIPPDKRTLPEFLFQPELTPYFHAESRRQLHTLCVYHLKYKNELYRRTEWYQALVTRMQKQQEFAQMWRTLNVSSLSYAGMDNVLLSVNNPLCAMPIWVTLAQMPFNLPSMLYILFLLPADDYARDFLDEIGCHREQRERPAWQTCEAWEHQPRDMHPDGIEPPTPGSEDLRSIR